ncbi:fructose-bisphosphate aldolase class I [Candidatus Saccharibacteria bacterium]|nr:fructose-bisphosphate aldolase class I [Candidatus Saccharibacteria bacterium]
MSEKILIVGNVLKDIYLRLDERKEELETDENGTKWLNWGFNSSSHEFFKRTSVYSGVVVALEVLRKFGIEADVFGEKVEGGGEAETDFSKFKNVDYRYILCAGEQISYLVPSEKHPTKIDVEDFSSEYGWIFVDRSAIITKDLTDKLLAILEKNKRTKLAVYAPKRVSKSSLPLIERAKLVFTDGDLANAKTTGKVCYISEDGARIGGVEARFTNLTKTELFTHLTTYSIVAASVFGAGLRGKSANDALLMAKLNIENTRLDETLKYSVLEELLREEKMNGVNLRQMAKELMTRGKGILAADESGGSIHKKFEQMGILDDYQHRRDYRNLFFSTEGLEKYVNGVILFDETARQTADDGRNFVDFLTTKGIIPGIKVDQGLVNFSGSTEKYTAGLEGLLPRMDEYYKMGLRFAKWRAAFEITDKTPTKNAILRNVEILAEYALICQRAKIVPIVEPEVVYDGDYSIEKCAAVTGIIIRELFRELEEKKVQMNAVILKVNMVSAGKQFREQSSPEEVALWTARVLRRFVPKDLAGVVFLSGGQTPEQATRNLQAITNEGPFPWPVSFSFARAVQGPALEAWKGDNYNYPKAKQAFLERLVANTEALKKRS